ncbi:MAG: DUF3459 domain-containing protein, partial [Flavisolibacter sp.]
LNRKNLLCDCDEKKNVLVLHRWTDGQNLVCLMNFSKKIQSFMPPSNIQQWKKVFDSAATEWGGRGNAQEIISGGVAGGTSLELQPESILIYADKIHDENEST